jgi:hypothetical protein
VENAVSFLDGDGVPMVCGGSFADGEISDACFKYPPEGEFLWVPATSMNHERRWAAGVRLDDNRYWVTGRFRSFLFVPIHIYLLIRIIKGGFSTRENMLKSTEIYDSSTGSFSDSIDLPQPLINHCLGEFYDTTTNTTQIILTGKSFFVNFISLSP